MQQVRQLVDRVTSEEYIAPLFVYDHYGLYWCIQYLYESLAQWHLLQKAHPRSQVLYWAIYGEIQGIKFIKISFLHHSRKKTNLLKNIFNLFRIGIKQKNYLINVVYTCKEAVYIYYHITIIYHYHSVKKQVNFPQKWAYLILITSLPAETRGVNVITRSNSCE